jgi:hypothetical protein
MDKLLEFIDRLCLDEKLYWHVPSRAGGGDAEVAWERAAKPQAWRVKPAGHNAWMPIAAEALAATLERHDLDMGAFRRQVGASIMTQAVFADMVLQGANELFGEDVVRQSVEDTRAFLTTLAEAAATITKGEKSVQGNTHAGRGEGDLKRRLKLVVMT